ncbi:lysozyme inhibitor LprI family protein [Sphingomonas immobilis]|uniref:Lysozyme inhibitor LprI family protein n=1 Tax=Sphingomonas immobilis TaxID=3063997 RepID=A0ABT9A3J3_9SPHN|nr:lysozyme inhibitor LprI family protein [Sphingomonas sp. CA1-15]MDO7844113.1 lysozyme inhibitor LprI family protein [Sphingomonas sp. CA1-15]
MISLLLLALAAPDHKPGATPTPVAKPTPGPLTKAALADYAKADGEMAAQWKLTNAFMKGKDALNKTRGGGFGYAAALLESQRAWIRYRDTACAVEGGVHAGDPRQGLIIAQCKTALTNARRLQLKGLTVVE